MKSEEFYKNQIEKGINEIGKGYKISFETQHYDGLPGLEISLLEGNISVIKGRATKVDYRIKILSNKKTHKFIFGELQGIGKDNVNTLEMISRLNEDIKTRIKN